MTDEQTMAERLRAIPTTLAADILKDNNIAERSVSGFPVRAGPASAFAGPAKVIAFLPGRPELRRAGAPLNFTVIDSAGPGEVLVLCAGGSDNGAVFGDMLATRALQRGISGAVVDGAVRDLDGLDEVGLPVLAGALSTRAAHTTLVPQECPHPVRFGTVTVMPGDWVLADRDGVIFLTLELIELLFDGHKAALSREAFSKRLLQSGFALSEVFPLPASLSAMYEKFAAGGEMPDLAEVRATLDAGGAQ